ncbi:glycine betaine ABC transporter substrate-binding protein [Paracoccus sediminis]|uniref:Glycine betaine ABC transporter substrate-binding protein n=1 Tax=Paracoccus sediminis TaxID=1214787 RepID=A0A238WNG2_9RHOB|nr:glycine betaine ABC transporter substrate-binding protein [Paracoccus sediminis]TBN50442.1 glycine betaine ABC transporter substrate-binding protein [Paracoccus sediminis]SNR48065.1 glycine betaine/proline transport system substrate-binding protein [Paracoccus sediminis]
MHNFFTTILAGAVALGLAAPAMAQDDKVIKMGTMAWEDLTPIAGITKKVLEDKGFTVAVTEFSEWGIAYAALAKGDVQVMVSQIDYAASDYWDRNKSRLEKISPVSHGLYQGIAVPRYVTIDSIEQLNENADQFGGRIVGIEPGAGVMREAADVVSQYGLDLQLVEGSTAAMTAALQSATDRQEPIAVIVWEPSWMVQKYDTKFLADPKGIFAPPQTYYWIGQDGFSAENPEAREILASVYVPLADITAINAAVNGGKTMDEAVADWTEAHADLIGRWSNIKAY